jgi:hypothetical protein
MKYRILAWVDVSSDISLDKEDCRLILLKGLHKQPGSEPVGIDIQEHAEKPHR